MHTTDADLTPSERLREIAAILAAGLLRLRTCAKSSPESAIPGQETAPERNQESAEN